MFSPSTESLQTVYPGPNKKTWGYGISRLLLWSSIVVSLTSCICAIALFTQPTLPFLTRKQNQGRLLRRPNPYINLDHVYDSNSEERLPFPPIFSFAHVFLQIQPRDDNRKFLPEDERGYSSIEGFIYPDDRHFVVSPETSTVIQIRHQDYGMENCTLVLGIPDLLQVPFDPALRISRSSMVEIWMLDNTREISRYDLWDYAPARTRLFASVTVTKQGWNGSEHSFHCPSTSFSTFEFACKSGDKSCYVEFWQRKTSAPNGVYVIQRDSLTTRK